MTDPVISVRGLHCRYGDVEAVLGVDLDVARGELFALLGTNGAGKTTALETIEGQRSPDAGTVRVFGLDPYADRARVRHRVGIMLQDSGFAADLTVAETVQTWRTMIGRPADMESTMEALDLGPKRDVRIRQLSGGERRRLDLVLATAGRPDVLFLDEPTTGLDPESRKATWQLVRGLLADGTTVLLTTHYLEEAEQHAHRLAIMHEGSIAVSGTLVDVLATQQAVIAFDLAEAAALPLLRGTAEVDARRVHIRTPALQRDLHTVLDWARDHDLMLHGLRAQHASLDDVFHSVRAGAAPSATGPRKVVSA